MSSILKALQKLDRETADARHPDDPHRALRQLVPRKMAGRSRGLMFRNAAFAAFAAIFLGAVSWAVWRHPFPAPRSAVQKPSHGAGSGVDTAPPPPQTESSVQNPALPPVTHRSSVPSTARDIQPIPSEPLPSQKGPVPSPPASPHASRPAAVKPAESAVQEPSPTHGTPTEPGVPAGSPARPGGLAADAASKPGPGPLRKTQRPPATSQAAAPVRTIPTAPLGKPLPATDAQPRTRPPAGQRIPQAAALPATGHKDIPVKSQDEAGLTIQALVWSTAPEDRLVVVNGNILKEGGVIDGASVAFIGEDYIIMSQGGARWKLKFQLK